MRPCLVSWEGESKPGADFEAGAVPSVVWVARQTEESPRLHGIRPIPSRPKILTAV